jgi:hypothetical protein
MANVRVDQRGMVIEINHDESNELMGAMAAADAAMIAKVITVFGIASTVAGYIGAAIATHILWELATFKASEKGNGLILYVDPYTLQGVLPFGMVIAHTRTGGENPDPWAVNDDGVFKTSYADEIRFHIDRGAGSPDDCKFVLVNDCDWDKAYALRVGNDHWWVMARGHDRDENGSWFNDLPSTAIEFQKPQLFGRWGPVGLTLHNFEGLHATDITTFTWAKDS